MTSFSRRLTIRNRTPIEVFRFISDPANDPLWRKSAGSFEWLTDETQGVGSRFRATDRLAGLKISYEVEVTHWEPPSLYGARTGGMATVEFIAELTSDGDTSTTVDLHGRAQFNGVLRPFGRLFEAQFGRQFDVEWDNLKTVLESHPPAAR